MLFMIIKYSDLFLTFGEAFIQFSEFYFYCVFNFCFESLIIWDIFQISVQTVLQEKYRLWMQLPQAPYS